MNLTGGEPEYQGQADLMSRVETANQADMTRNDLATPEENFEYQDLMRRFLFFISDDRQASPKMKGPMQQILDSIGRESVPLEQSLGMALFEALKLLTKNAKDQGYEYSPDVILQAATGEMSSHLYILAKAKGKVRKGPPSIEEGGSAYEEESLEDMAAADPLFAEQLQNSNMGESAAGDIDYELSLEEVAFLDKAELVAAQAFGDYLVKTGQLDQGSWQKGAQGLVMGEYENGALEDSDIGIDQATGERMLMDHSRIASKGGE